MAKMRADSLIKSLREKKGLTQIQLSDGICSQETLSRLENGMRLPQPWIFESLLKRLGEEPEYYPYAFITKKDKKIADLKFELKSLLRNKDEESMIQAEKLIAELEKDKTFNEKAYEKLNSSFLHRAKATVAFKKKKYDDLYEHALNAVRVTIPHFDLNDIDAIDTYSLTFDEIWAINQIGASFLQRGELNIPTNIFLKLIQSVNKHSYYEDEEGRRYIAILYNLITSLGRSRRYLETLKYCEQGLELCHRHQHSYYYPLILFNKACSLLYLSRKEETLELLQKVFTLFKAYDRIKELEQGQKWLYTEFKLTT